MEISEDPNNDIADDECENVDTNDEEIPMVMDDPPSDTDERINMEEIISKLQGNRFLVHRGLCTVIMP